MPHAARKSTKPKTAPEPEPDEPESVEPEDEPRGGTVALLDDARVDFDLDDDLADEADLPPFVFRLGGRVWEVPVPTAGQTLDAEQAPYLEDFFRILFGDDAWEEFEETFRVQKPSATWRLGRAISRAFKMDPVSMQENAEREESNRAGRRGNRRQPRRGRSGR